ncbi:protein CDV3 homolog isoform X2 [Archocentrus centrarchus]|uniref:protein CDV3 homolog isoform X2 n=1 Tax=Archocentrus centrarchus TaxID=63155 RepID=UPI0011E9C653|nr:protein CDV3 homolog isoform X2 [Archocentrus centrarchus]
MADVQTEKSLDDFFAKRDKKKKKEKGKGKESAAGPASAALKKTKKEKEKSAKNENQDAQIDKDEEWKDFEQKEVDYSGLRLQALQISDEKEEEEYEKEEVGEEGEIILVSGDKGEKGPWNKSGAAAAAPPPAPVENVEAPEAKPAGVYRPPGARLTTTKRAHNQGPPEIFSDTQFPSLLATAKHVETRKDREMEKTFEVVKHRNRGREETSGASMQHLQLDNQYAILGDK